MALPPPAPNAAPQPAAAARPGWLRRTLLNPFFDLLKAGLAPGQLALTVGLGVAFGLTPTFGIVTVLSAATALRLRLNVAAMQLVAHLMTPLQLLLLLPLLRWGAVLLGQGAAVRGLTLGRLRALIDHDGWAVLRLLWRAQLGALLLWALAAGPLVALLYVGLKPVFARLGQRFAAA